MRERLRRWLWGDPDQQLPDEIRDASHRVLNEAMALHALVNAMHTKSRENEPARRA